MAGLKEKIQEDVKTAMRARNQHEVTTLRGLLAAVKQVEVDSRIEAKDEHVAQVLVQEMKKRRDVLVYAEQQKRQDLIDQNKTELTLLQRYLGEQLDQAELERIVEEAIAGGADNIGKVMGVLNAKYKGRFEGKTASELVRERLGKKS